MEQYEYKTVNEPFEVNEAGLKGWELCATRIVNGNCTGYHLKRKIIVPPPQEGILVKEVNGKDLKEGDEFWADGKWNPIAYIPPENNWDGNNELAVKDFKNASFLIKVTPPKP